MVVRGLEAGIRRGHGILCCHYWGGRMRCAYRVVDESLMIGSWYSDATAVPLKSTHDVLGISHHGMLPTTELTELPRKYQHSQHHFHSHAYNEQFYTFKTLIDSFLNTYSSILMDVALSKHHNSPLILS